MLADPLEKSHVHTRKNEKAKLVYTYTYPYSHPGKVISIFAVLLNLRTAACLMCSELQHRCHSLSYAGRHLAGCSQNTEKKSTMCTTSKISVCSTWGQKEARRESKTATACSLLRVFVPHLAAKMATSRCELRLCCIKDARHTFQSWASQKIWKSDCLTLMIWGCLELQISFGVVSPCTKQNERALPRK